VHLLIWCVHCGGHEFKIDTQTAENAGIVRLICPSCRKTTDVHRQSDGTLWVRPHPTDNADEAET
jgi:hypothetical protein